MSHIGVCCCVAAAKSQLHHVLHLCCAMHPKFKLPVCTAKYGLKVHFLCLFIALDLFCPTPQLTYTSFGQYVMRSWPILVATATCMHISQVGPVLHPFLLVPVFQPSGLAYNSFFRSKPSGSVTTLIDSGVTHSFVLQAIVQQYGLLLETCDKMLV